RQRLPALQRLGIVAGAPRGLAAERERVVGRRPGRHGRIAEQVGRPGGVVVAVTDQGQQVPPLRGGGGVGRRLFCRPFGRVQAAERQRVGRAAGVPRFQPLDGLGAVAAAVGLLGETVVGRAAGGGKL